MYAIQCKLVKYLTIIYILYTLEFKTCVFAFLVLIALVNIIFFCGGREEGRGVSFGLYTVIIHVESL